MNRTLTSLAAIGASAAFLSRGRRKRGRRGFSDLFSQKSMKRIRKRVNKAFR
ncbi:DUF3918 domain-containing protein [Pontibacillus marinus]|uniref:DUF3918 domain-containing protein n=1 Tax=Pontibacillus marinus BH030004 = DSM 16465 TaxID=1385511 RepID=A0A0A5G0T0_9BACI|nr:DUF3918 domain-containing protein [Pontibacillus marinus]KGX84723.1 hypothetical protein N783_16245 [Pontibacillus marinus BH030004 = DSM 16465]